MVDAPETRPSAQTLAGWHPLTRIAFRFSFVYFGLYCLLFAQILIAFVGPLADLLPRDAVIWQMRFAEPVTGWVGRNIFGVDTVLHLNGSGDQSAIWVMIGTALLIAVLAAGIWTALDRRRTEYRTLNAWFLVVIRWCLGGQMLWYAMTKVFPNQMPLPSLTALLTPYGNMGPLEVLWGQVGSSPVYEILLGIAEATAGLLLFVPRTATAGALLSALCLAQIWILNMTFDVPVKIHSFTLLLMSLLLLAPQARRLANVLVLQRPSDPVTQPPLSRSPQVNRIVVAVGVLVGLWVTAGRVMVGVEDYGAYGNGAPTPPLYGIWNVAEFEVDGAVHPPLLTDTERWRRLVFDRAKANAYQRMDDSFVPVQAQVDTEAHTLTLSKLPESRDAVPPLLAKFTYEQPAKDRLVLRGDIEGRPARLTLDYKDPNSFPQRSRGFHWTQEAPDSH
ncbi:DoxX family protein [Nocardia panacis]|uniref:DoxX family protein n=1 Tax=Nocardia panacis TaxID=2340916 RepID=A0A3A4JXD3_9NOCA|nr:DoxX family protein [Nocardia panacis]